VTSPVPSATEDFGQGGNVFPDIRQDQSLAFSDSSSLFLYLRDLRESSFFLQKIALIFSGN
jgi:hypothetical protein